MRTLKTLSSLLALSAGLGAAEVTGAAQVTGGFSWAQIQLGYLSQQNSACVKDSTGFGLGFGQWLQPRWGWEAAYLHSRIEPTSHLWKAKEDHLDATLLFRPFLETGRWIPFVRAGAGASRLENPLSLSGSTSTRLNLLLGAGTQVRFGAKGLGSLEVRSVTVESSTQRQELEALVGLGFRWGGTARTKAAPVPAPLPAPVEPAPVPAPVSAPAPVPPPVPAPAPAPAPEPSPAPLPAKIVLGDAVLHFPNNGDALDAEAVQAIKAVARQLKAYAGEYTLQVGGHTSSLGSVAHNKALSLRRARSVANVLVAAGIPESRVACEGFGPEKPVADNKTQEGQSRNRRVEIDVKTTQAVDKIRTETGVMEAPAPARKAPKGGKVVKPKS
ncbi:MAG: OmpA family protein [Acidobacteria bacterium]|nr:OmpA family protein [Acidobacteriota bacterium]MBI3487310.1 OmpA family protein [Acidobacteriota bacterium]